MIFFLDENFPRAAVDFLVSRGHQAIDIRGAGQEGSDDSAIFAMAQRAGAVFLTTDRDFFHTIPHLEKTHDRKIGKDRVGGDYGEIQLRWTLGQQPHVS